ncbi:hypothetical protein E4T56_gene3901 [Termitomyces sp. T112]|nr:hypothetical protein E4T56_gene3901 [Termitomyces sp. T112]
MHHVWSTINFMSLKVLGLPCVFLIEGCIPRPITDVSFGALKWPTPTAIATAIAHREVALPVSFTAA